MYGQLPRVEKLSLQKNCLFVKSKLQAITKCKTNNKQQQLFIHGYHGIYKYNQPVFARDIVTTLATRM
jgi:hypothetical protein